MRRFAAPGSFVLVIVLAVVAFYMVNNRFQEKKKEMEEKTNFGNSSEKAQSFSDAEALLDECDAVAAKAYSQCTMIEEVLNNVSGKVSSTVTDKFTKGENGSFLTADEALKLLFEDPDFAKAQEELNAKYDAVTAKFPTVLASLENNVPLQMALNQCADTLKELRNYAVNPVGGAFQYSGLWSGAKSRYMSLISTVRISLKNAEAINNFKK